MFYLPLFHNLQNADCLVVGGGSTAWRKIRWLKRAHANITVLAPSINVKLNELVGRGELQWVEDVFSPATIHEGLTLVVSATNDADVSARVHQACVAKNILVNCVDQPELCTVVFPAIVDRLPIIVAISSMGQAPTLSRVVRGWIEARLPPNVAQLGELASRLRDSVKNRLSDIEQRKQFWQHLFNGHAAEQAMAGQLEAAEITALAQLNLAGESVGTATGQVALVGAGPGDPELITLKALRLLQSADVVLYDKLVNPDILDYARRDAELVYVGKQGPRPGTGPHRVDNRTNQQHSINDLIVQHAEQGRHVVRLKGGDPFIYGRGGEELETVVGAGLDVIVVPGITAAMGAAAVAGIPLTYRNLSQSVRFVTGHRIENVVNLDWPEMLRDDQTLVIYMGLIGLQQIMQTLLDRGCEPERPVAVIENATYPDQRMVRGDVGNIFSLVSAAGLDGPSVVIVGKVVDLVQGVAKD